MVVRLGLQLTRSQLGSPPRRLAVAKKHGYHTLASRFTVEVRCGQPMTQCYFSEEPCFEHCFEYCPMHNEGNASGNPKQEQGYCYCCVFVFVLGKGS